MSEILKKALSNIPPPSTDLPDRIFNRVHEMRVLEKEFIRASRWEMLRSMILCLGFIVIGIVGFQFYGDSLRSSLQPFISAWATLFHPIFEQYQAFEQEIRSAAKMMSQHYKHFTQLDATLLIILASLTGLMILYDPKQTDIFQRNH